jgi:hypothetical protein
VGGTQKCRPQVPAWHGGHGGVLCTAAREGGGLAGGGKQVGRAQRDKGRRRRQERFVSAEAIGGMVFVVVFGAALFGRFLGRVLPEEHLRPDAREVIKISMAMVATFAALVLGLLTASSKSSFDEKQAEMTTASARVVYLDRTLAEYGADAEGARKLLKGIVTRAISTMWPEEGDRFAPEVVGQGTGAETMQERLLALSPQNDAQRWLQSTALQISRDVAESRWLFIEQTGSAIQWPFLTIVVFWLAVIFASFGLFAPRNPSVSVALAIAALSVAGSIYLILELDQPYSGLIKISSVPLRTALAHLGQPLAPGSKIPQ